MTPAAWLVAYCGVIAGASLAGGWLPTRVRLTHTRMQLVMSFVAGLMLGVALLHMVPHAASALPSIDATVGWTLLGLLGMFFLIRIFHFHQHGSDEGGDEGGESAAGHGHSDQAGGHPEHRPESHGHHHAHGSCAHDHPVDTPHDHGLPEPAGSPFGWLGLALGLALHTLIDGLALGASVVAESHGHGEGWLFGVGTFLAVVLHKPLDAMSITSLMRTAGWSVRRQQLVNLVFSSLCPLGALGFWFGMSHYLESHQHWLGAALAFSAGVFLCISLGDLLPEVHFHTHDRLKLSTALLVGVALAYGVGLLEPKHIHDRPSHGGRDAHDSAGHSNR